MRIAFIDTVYPDFLKTVPLGKGSYQEELDKVLARQFGTADFLSREFRKLGWEAVDILYNHDELQKLWAREHGIGGLIWSSLIEHQLSACEPDIVFLQDLSIEFRNLRVPIVAQCSCPWPGDAAIRRCDIVLTSFPHYISRIEKLGMKAVFMPLAFHESVLGYELGRCACGHMRECHEGPNTKCYGIRCECSEFRTRHLPVWPPRVHDCVFVGGVGMPSHWKRGMSVLTDVARDIPSFKWWGYGRDLLPVNSLLWQAYQGQAWGRDMYDILLRSKIVINRHGEVAEGYANNMRLFEATGCGALLLTEAAPNLSDYFASNECVTYSSPQDAVMKIKYYLEHESERAAIAARGQKRTLRDHTYQKRIPKIAEVLEAAMVKA